MKIRKSLVAAATAVALSTTGVTVATAEEGTAAENNQTTTNDTSGSSLPSLSSSDSTEEGEESEEGGEEKEDKVDPSEIRNWIGVITAVISAVGAAFTLAQRMDFI